MKKLLESIKKPKAKPAVIGGYPMTAPQLYYNTKHNINIYINRW